MEWVWNIFVTEIGNDFCEFLLWFRISYLEMLWSVRNVIVGCIWRIKNEKCIYGCTCHMSNISLSIDYGDFLSEFRLFTWNLKIAIPYDFLNRESVNPWYLLEYFDTLNTIFTFFIKDVRKITGFFDPPPPFPPI